MATPMTTPAFLRQPTSSYDTRLELQSATKPTKNASWNQSSFSPAAAASTTSENVRGDAGSGAAGRAAVILRSSPSSATVLAGTMTVIRNQNGRKGPESAMATTVSTTPHS